MSFVFISSCYLMQGLLENFSLIEFASLFVRAGPTEILLNQLLCFFFSWIKFCPTVRFVIHLPIWTQLEEKKCACTFYSQIFCIYIFFLNSNCSNKTYCKSKILSSPNPNATDRIVVIFPKYTGTGECTFSHRI